MSRRSPASSGLLCAEQMRTDLAYPSLPVRVLAHHAGISLGFYGTSHHATEDLGLLRSMANMTVVCPCDATSTRRAIYGHGRPPGPGLSAARTRTRARRLRPRTRPFEVGRLARLRDGDDLTIVANGITVHAGARGS